MTDPQHANGTRRNSDFPASWGTPPAGSDEKRAAWIIRNINASGKRSGCPRDAGVALELANSMAECSSNRSARAALAKANSKAHSAEHALAWANHLALNPPRVTGRAVWRTQAKATSTVSTRSVPNRHVAGSMYGQYELDESQWAAFNALPLAARQAHAKRIVDGFADYDG